jgi:hypothetical protein
MAALNHQRNQDLGRQYDDLYERYGRPLEADHRGEYLAVSPTGQTMLGPTLRDVARRARARFGPGNFLYKIGEKAVGKWR